MKAGGMGRRVIVLLLAATVAWLASGCVWGVVRDANTGQPIAGALVIYWDWDANSNAIMSTETDANGLYSFDHGLPVRPGNTGLFVRAPNFEAAEETIIADFDDNPNASAADPSSFWQVENFDLAQKAGFFREETQGYSIAFPRDWQAGPLPWVSMFGSSESSGASIVAPATKDGRAPQCDVSSTRLEEGQTPESQWTQNLAFFPEKVVKREDAVVAGKLALKIFYVTTSPDSGMGGVAFLFQRGNQLWAIDCFSDDIYFLTNASTFTSIAKSFQFTR